MNIRYLKFMIILTSTSFPNPSGLVLSCIYVGFLVADIYSSNSCSLSVSQSVRWSHVVTSIRHLESVSSCFYVSMGNEKFPILCYVIFENCDKNPTSTDNGLVLFISL